MNPNIQSSKGKFKECACRGCKRAATRQLEIKFVYKRGWFCDSCTTDLLFHGLAKQILHSSDLMNPACNQTRTELSYYKDGDEK
jgi:hypothetical protein